MTGKEILPLDKTTVLSRRTRKSTRRASKKKVLYKYKSGNANSFGKIINPAGLFIKMRIMN